MSNKKSQRGISTMVVILGVVTLLLVGGYFLLRQYGYLETLQEIPSPIREITEVTPTGPGETQAPIPGYAKPIPPGEQTYFVSGKFTGPTITKVTINPQDAEPGEIQKITVEVSDTNPVTRVYVTVKLDTKSNTFDLALVSGTATQGVWEGEAPFPDDTLFNNYTVTEVAQSATGTSTTTTTIR